MGPSVARLLDADDRFEQAGEHPFAVDARQGNGDLGIDDAVLEADVVSRPPGLQRQVLLPPGQEPGQRTGAV